MVSAIEMVCRKDATRPPRARTETGVSVAEAALVAAVGRKHLSATERTSSSRIDATDPPVPRLPASGWAASRLSVMIVRS